MNMSEVDLPARLKKYGGHHIKIKRIALTLEQARPLPSFSVETKRKDPRYAWYKRTYGDKCWELDALDPNTLRDVVRAEITALIDAVLWAQQEAEQERDKRSVDLHTDFLQEEDERQRLATESHLRHWKLFQSLNSASCTD
jgi:hypothetical protein